MDIKRSQATHTEGGGVPLELCNGGGAQTKLEARPLQMCENMFIRSDNPIPFYRLTEMIYNVALCIQCRV